MVSINLKYRSMVNYVQLLNQFGFDYLKLHGRVISCLQILYKWLFNYVTFLRLSLRFRPRLVFRLSNKCLFSLDLSQTFVTHTSIKRSFLDPNTSL